MTPEQESAAQKAYSRALKATEDEIRGFDFINHRMNKFFADGRFFAWYERKIGEPLIQFYDIALWLADAVPNLTRDAVTRKFLWSVKMGAFGQHGPRQTITELIDLDAYNIYDRTQYGLRPSVVMVDGREDLMRAKPSVWVKWIETQGWPVPVELRPQGAELAGALMAPESYRSGAAGAPSSVHLIETEMRRRIGAGEALPTMAKESRYLVDWLKATHPNAPRCTAKTIQNKLGPTFRQLSSFPK